MGDDGVKRVTVARQAGIAAIDVAPIASLGKISADEAQMPVVVEQTPAGDRLGVKTAVREGDDQRRPRTQHPPDFAQHLDRLHQVLTRATYSRPPPPAPASPPAPPPTHVFTLT